MEKRKAEEKTMKGQAMQDAAQDRTAVAQTMGAPGAFPKRLRENRRIGLLALLGAVFSAGFVYSFVSLWCSFFGSGFV